MKEETEMNDFFNYGAEAHSQELSEHRFSGLAETELERGGGWTVLGTIANKKLCCHALKRCSLLSHSNKSLGALSYMT